jgi:inorganic pyrophosphatase
MIIKVFIENEAGSDQKNIFNEKTLEYKKTVTVSRKYPYTYGFILDTVSDDGDNLDCYVLTSQKLKSGQIIECQPIGLMEQLETTINSNGSEITNNDHNVLAVIGDEDIVITDEIKKNFSDFTLHVFDHLPHKKNRVGEFLDKNYTVEYIKKAKCR